MQPLEQEVVTLYLSIARLKEHLARCVMSLWFTQDQHEWFALTTTLGPTDFVVGFAKTATRPSALLATTSLGLNAHSFISNVPLAKLTNMTTASLQFRAEIPDTYAEPRGYVYLLRCNLNGAYKIGKAAIQRILPRMKELKVTTADKKNELIGAWIVNSYHQLERELHRAYASKRMPQTEYFVLSDKEVEDLRIDLGFNGVEALVPSKTSKYYTDILFVERNDDGSITLQDENGEAVVIGYGMISQLVHTLNDMKNLVPMNPLIYDLK